MSKLYPSWREEASRRAAKDSPEWLVTGDELESIDFKNFGNRSYRILMTGSRDWTNESSMRSALKRAIKISGRSVEDITLIHGAARGADLMLAKLAESIGMNTEAHPADWSTHNDNCPEEKPVGNGCWKGRNACKRAGFRRNQEMIDSGAELLLAFIKEESAGATGTLNLWLKESRPTLLCRENANGDLTAESINL